LNDRLTLVDARYLNYGEEQWKSLVVEHLSDVELYCDEVRKNFEATLDWLHEHACSRSYGLGKYMRIALRDVFAGTFTLLWRITDQVC